MLTLRLGRWFIRGTAAALLLTAAGASISSQAARSAAPSLTPGASSLADIGIITVPSTPPPGAIPQTDAIGVARGALGAASSAAGVTATVQFVLLTDEAYLTPPTPGNQPHAVISSRPVWLVQLEGLSIPAVMRPDDVHAEYYVAVDAMTGDYLEAFSYK
jgi:hypothetical protein